MVEDGGGTGEEAINQSIDQSINQLISDSGDSREDSRGLRRDRMGNDANTKVDFVAWLQHEVLSGFG